MTNTNIAQHQHQNPPLNPPFSSDRFKNLFFPTFHPTFPTTSTTFYNNYNSTQLSNSLLSAGTPGTLPPPGTHDSVQLSNFPLVSDTPIPNNVYPSALPHLTFSVVYARAACQNAPTQNSTRDFADQPHVTGGSDAQCNSTNLQSIRDFNDSTARVPMSHSRPFSMADRFDLQRAQSPTVLGIPFSGGVTTHATDICQHSGVPVSDSERLRFSGVEARPLTYGRSQTFQAGPSTYATGLSAPLSEFASGVPLANLASVEDGFTMERRPAVTDLPNQKGRTLRDFDRMGRYDEGIDSSAFPTGHDCSPRGPGGSGLSRMAPDTAGSDDHAIANSTDNEPYAFHFSHDAVSSFDQTGYSGFRGDPDRGRTNSSTGAPHDTEAQNTLGLAGAHSTLRFQQDGSGKVDGHTMCNETDSDTCSPPKGSLMSGNRLNTAHSWKSLTSRVLPWPGCVFKPTKTPGTDFERSSPLHVKCVPSLDYDRLLQMARVTPYYERLCFLLKYNTDHTMYPRPAGCPRPPPPSNSLPQGFAQALCEAGIACPLFDFVIDDAGNRRHCTAEDVMYYGIPFTVYECTKHRQRPILWPKEVNSLIEYTSAFSLPNVRQQKQNASLSQKSRCYDFAGSFWHHPLLTRVPLIFAFVGDDGRIYVMLRMVMGFGPACEIQHVSLLVLVSHVVAYIKHCYDVDLPNLPFVDNVRFSHDDDHVLNATDAFFRSLCDYVHFRINDEPALNAIHTAGIFLGIEYKYGISCSLSTKTRDKLLAARSIFFSAHATFRDIFETFGILFFASDVLNFRLATVYHSFKFFRRRCATFSKGLMPLHAPALVWASIIPEMRQWFHSLLNPTATATLLRQRNNRHSLFSDASLLGGGAVLFLNNGEVLTWQRKWSPLEAGRSINELEAMALTEALEHFFPLLQNSGVDIFVDNTSVLFGAPRGYSASFFFNQRLRALSPLLAVLDYSLSFVPSKKNVSDSLSRNFPN